MADQEAHFSNLSTSFMYLAGVCGPLDEVRLLIVVGEGEVLASPLGYDVTYVLKDTSFQDFFDNCSCLNSEDVADIEGEERARVFS